MPGESNASFSKPEEPSQHTPLVVVLNYFDITQVPTQRDKGKGKLRNYSQTTLPMNFIISNTMEVNNNCFRRHCEALVSIYKPSLLTLLETKMTDRFKLSEDLGFDSHTHSAAKGQLLKGITHLSEHEIAQTWWRWIDHSKSFPTISRTAPN
ncbi:hypothetical protein H5410_011085 [Solanum commersonii]|uniref:Uncharacterized protein n=1 Tax=Solanum commersonii TaxID=4109 RepID=A0A9J6ANM9_SOLCO|nr:hypothetical protein H5410_011085 [Solanum commersonii]